MEYTLEEVAEHNQPDDLWLAIRGKVYNVTAFRDDHPGGGELLDEEAGAFLFLFLTSFLSLFLIFYL